MECVHIVRCTAHLYYFLLFLSKVHIKECTFDIYVIYHLRAGLKRCLAPNLKTYCNNQKSETLFMRLNYFRHKKVEHLFWCIKCD